MLGRTVRTSSKRPVTATSAAAARMTAACDCQPGSTSEQATAPSAMATPPRYGRGRGVGLPGLGVVGDAVAQRVVPGEGHEQRDEHEGDAAGNSDTHTIDHCCLPSAVGEVSERSRAERDATTGSPERFQPLPE